MSGFRFSLLGIIAVVTLVALGLGAMASQSPLAISGAYTLFVGAVCLAVAVALAPGGVNRPFCVGFAVFGLTYWFLEMRTMEASLAPWRSGVVVSGMPAGGSSPELVTRPLVHWLAASVSHRFDVGTHVQARWTNNGQYYPARITKIQGTQYEIQWDSGGTLQLTPLSWLVHDDPSNLIAGHALMGSLCGLLGGVVAAALAKYHSTSRPPLRGDARSQPNPNA